MKVHHCFRRSLRPHQASGLALLLILAACTGVPEVEPGGSAGKVGEVAAALAPASNAPGYVHTLNRSKFNIGSGATPRFEFGIQKIVGSDGVFGTIPQTGLVMAIPNADAHSQSVGPLTQSETIHNATVLKYFLDAGLPSDQVGPVNAHATVYGSGQRLLSSETPGPLFDSYTSIVTRVVGGVPVCDSFAWARFNADGDVVQESVYWPSIPGEVVQGAIALRANLADPVYGPAYLAKLPAGLDAGRVVIRHSPGTSLASFEAVASYDASMPGHMRVLRHFDATGREFSLTSEGEWTPQVSSARQLR